MQTFVVFVYSTHVHTCLPHMTSMLYEIFLLQLDFRTHHCCRDYYYVLYCIVSCLLSQSDTVGFWLVLEIFVLALPLADTVCMAVSVFYILRSCGQDILREVYCITIATLLFAESVEE